MEDFLIIWQSAVVKSLQNSAYLSLCLKQLALCVTQSHFQ